ncbi:MAG: chromosome segregation protein SMC, partial [Clostridioides sp.]|nr:chromosome segregation protein SMC [Clostridioides sp.]
MYLKRLELKGFKSFPYKTDIIFNKGVTAIVGPNGSGKSNISDAVRWVLGEQSMKSLRGDKLEDVIFIGTDSKPAMNYCEVSLTLDNEDRNIDIDYSEITIKRRAYKSGESQFFLNNKSCRLKDIKELLLDTGIGKDGYCIVEQGKVDEILSNNPSIRRKIFDEACGIAKYRYKKTEAEKNLATTKDNLDRICDIYDEVSGRIKPLYEQQVKARKYIGFSDRLKKLEVNSFLNQLEYIDKEKFELKEHKRLIQRDIEEKEKEKEFLEQKYIKNQDEYEEVENKIEREFDYTKSVREILSETKKNLEINNEKSLLNANEIDQKKVKIKESKIKLQEIKEELEKIIKSNEIDDLKMHEIKSHIATFGEKNISKKIDLENLKNTIDSLKEYIIKNLNNKQKKSDEMSTQKANIENLNSRKSDVELELEEIEKELEVINKEIEKIDSKLHDTINLKNEFSRNKTSEEIQLNDLNEENNNLANELNTLNDNINHTNSKLKIYSDMENQLEGFNKGVKSILKNKSLKGIYGVLGQLIKVTPNYEKSIEAALGSTLQNIVSADEISAKKAIEYLKEKNLGRVTFLPVNIIENRKSEDINIQGENGILGLATDFVTCDDKFNNIIKSLLNKTVVAKTIDDAIDFSRKTKHRYKVTTLDGEIINIGGAMTGGSHKNNTSILSRRRAIDECIEQIQIFEKEKLSLENKINESKEKLDSCNLKIQNIEQKLKKLDNESFESNLIKKNLLNKIDSTSKNKEKLSLEKKQLEEKVSFANDRANKLEKDIKNIDVEIESSNKTIVEKQEILKSETSSFEDSRKEIDELNINLAKYEQIVENERKNIDRIKQEIAATNLEIETLNQEIEAKENQAVEYEKNNESFTGEIEKIHAMLKERSTNFEDLKNSKINLKETLKEVERDSKICERQFNSLKESLFKVESTIERTISYYEQIENTLLEQYELSLDKASELRDKTINVTKKEIVSLRKSIKELGNINIDSIKEYEEEKVRYDFLTVQKKDLEESVSAIEEIISSIEINMKNEFKNQFEIINEKYKYVHKKLFGGGSAEIIIENKEDVLSSDILIFSKPPGKKMKSLNLLSGGEKALTAISILFAIIMTKPTPFCILDEIEAPLDDANI